MALLRDAFGQITLEVQFSSPLLLWTGEGDLLFDSKTYLPSKLIGLTESQVALSTPQSHPSFQQVLSQTADRTLYFDNDPGPLTTIINLIWRETETDNWESAFVIEGRLSDARYVPSEALLTVNIEPILYDINHGITEGWNNASQLRRNSTDKGMEYINKLNQDIRWPP